MQCEMPNLSIFEKVQLGQSCLKPESHFEDEMCVFRRGSVFESTQLSEKDWKASHVGVRLPL